ncbi:hypothetical protein PTE30175_02345 [Pandoraea terrae]|uniref:YncE family protein n=1 Tax=Pandoraea terrae TaxID=1537710 RepID=A0A5E4V346_9BURK|nr:YncE family protein [Pandoraea terrae]VVE06626.1 hypothetical protein PTE30175_02345 [Pandoraea terrae]
MLGLKPSGVRDARPLRGGFLVAAMLSAFAAAHGAQAGSYHLEKQVTVKSSDTGWDYNSLDQVRGRMFIAHRKDGLQVYDIHHARVVKTLAQSTGTNTSALAPEFDVGLAGTTDGYVVVFRISSLKTLSRYKSDTDGFDGATFDKVSRRFAMIGEADSANKTTPVLFFDGTTGKAVGSVTIDSVKVDAPRSDGAGNILMPLRDKARIVKVDARTMKVVTTFPLDDCLQPAALEVDSAAQRIFVGCRGKGDSPPGLAVLDAASGTQLAKLPIGRGVDEVLFDERARQIVTANGEDANMTVIQQVSANDYRVAETVGTQPMARTGVMDAETGKIYLVNARYVIKYEEGRAPATHFFPDTFSVLTYAR